jgi:putative DNA primase/helicase
MQKGTIDIATGFSSRSKTWKNQTTTWEQFTERLKTSVRTNETLKEYLKASREDQGKIKDVGGYVGGYLVGGKRTLSSVGHRQLLTLDLDFATTDFFFDFEMLYSCAAFLHATHKHSPTQPRYRLIIPLDREVSPDEYSAISRRVAGNLGIDIFDPTTFDVNRLMYWPSNPKDVEYYWVEQKGEFLCADEVLSEYVDWKDSSLWPTSEDKIKEIKSNADKQEDPALKKGVVGAFCRTYGIAEAIEKFLPDTYKEEPGDRYTFSGGSTSAGLMVYENIWAYSHHGTDPASGRLCNSFDLVRLHLFGHLDKDEKGTHSFKRMEEMCIEDQGVKYTLAKERTGKTEELDEVNSEWMTALEIDAKGNFLSTANNLNLIFSHDPNLKGLFNYNTFDSKRYILRSAPWREVPEVEPMRNVDYAGVRNYIETTYGICSAHKIEDSLSLEIERHAVHPIREYLTGLNWDGRDRIGATLIDYFGAEDSSFTREAFKKMMVAAVARIMDPGCKFDYMLVLVGSQGMMKSSFLNVLGRGWFSDSFSTVQGKEALEQLQGAWIIEIAELSAFRKSEVESIKHFVSKQKDDFRPAYARSPETFKRQCVFFGTTNNLEFLKDPTGNRRFWPILSGQQPIKKKVFGDLEKEVDQLWAEAVELYNKGEKLYLSKEIEDQARFNQELHSEKDERLGMIMEYLDRLLPENWESMDLYDRRTWLDSVENSGTVIRDYVCTAEVWCECLGKNKEDMTRYNTREVNDLLRSLTGWSAKVSTLKFNIYGKQKYYERKLY